jgi:hypothetical protein
MGFNKQFASDMAAYLQQRETRPDVTYTVVPLSLQEPLPHTTYAIKGTAPHPFQPGSHTFLIDDLRWLEENMREQTAHERKNTNLTIYRHKGYEARYKECRTKVCIRAAHRRGQYDEISTTECWPCNGDNDSCSASAVELAQTFPIVRGDDND